MRLNSISTAGHLVSTSAASTTAVRSVKMQDDVDESPLARLIARGNEECRLVFLEGDVPPFRGRLPTAQDGEEEPGRAIHDGSRPFRNGKDRPEGRSERVTCCLRRHRFYRLNVRPGSLGGPPIALKVISVGLLSAMCPTSGSPVEGASVSTSLPSVMLPLNVLGVPFMFTFQTNVESSLIERSIEVSGFGLAVQSPTILLSATVEAGGVASAGGAASTGGAVAPSGGGASPSPAGGARRRPPRLRAEWSRHA